MWLFRLDAPESELDPDRDRLLLPPAVPSIPPADAAALFSLLFSPAVPVVLPGDGQEPMYDAVLREVNECALAGDIIYRPPLGL